VTEDLASQEAFANRLEPLSEQIVIFARRMLDRPEQAEDVLQNALATAWRLRQRFVEGTNFRAWIYRCLLHEVQNANRKDLRLRTLTLPPPESLPEHDFWATLESEMAYRDLLTDPARLLDRLDEDLAGALKRLGDSERLTLLLRAVGEFTCGEIAEILQVPKGTVMAQLFRARVKIRRSLGDSSRSSHRSNERSDL
jgi:RNA polymerase sigma-70 factor (ECF subfamily)